MTHHTNNQDNIVEVDLELHASGGDCVGHLPDGKTIFIPHTLPGERVRAVITEEKSRYCRGRVISIIRPSKDRITPRCPHFGICGGCSYQHLDYVRQLDVKRAILEDQLKRIGKISTPPVEAVIASPLAWNYRHTVQFHVLPEGNLGFREANSSRLVAISACHLPVLPINDFWPSIDLEGGTRVQRVLVRYGSDGELLVGFESEYDQAPQIELERRLSMVFLGKQGEIVLCGDNSSLFTVKENPFIASARSFFQVNLALAEKMVDYVIEEAQISGSSTVFDLYCGAGLFSRFLAPRVKELVGVEISESACNDFATNMGALENVSLYIGAVEEILPGLTKTPDLVLVDPPRAGLAKGVVDCLERSGAGQITYVSCDPVTLARDAALLIKAGYMLESIRPFDLFPQTHHIESVSLFKKASSS